MPILCVEGASAVGKSTTCQELAEKYNAYVVPEVNLLFSRPSNESATWYFERQVERWKIANEQLNNHDLVLLDGDVFQPLWYNWSYDFSGWQNLDMLRDFYRKHLLDDSIRFPDGYVVLFSDEMNLRKRKESDTTRRRGNFEKHLKFIEPKTRYFKEMNQFIPDYVRFVEAISIEDNVKSILEVAPSMSNASQQSISLNLFDHMIEWLRNNKAFAE